jgi:hypothetical protein
MPDHTARFLSHIDQDGPIIRPELGPCWVWKLGRDRDGYGLFNMSGRQWRAPRAAWTLLVAPIPDGLLICHRCDNPGCVRPEHLFLGDHGVNQRDKLVKGRNTNDQKTHCKHGHPFDEANTYFRKNRSGRACKACLRAHGRRRKASSEV